MKLAAALLRVAGVTAGLAESNGSLLPGLWLTSPAGWLPRTGISSGTLRSAVEYGLAFLCLSGVVVGVTDGRDYHGDSNGSEWHVGRSAQRRRTWNVSVYVHTVRRRIRRHHALRPPRDWTPRCHRLSHRRPRLVGWNLGGRLSKLTMAFNCLLTSVIAVVNVNEVRWGYIVLLWWLLHFVYWGCTAWEFPLHQRRVV